MKWPVVDWCCRYGLHRREVDRTGVLCIGSAGMVRRVQDCFGRRGLVRNGRCGEFGSVKVCHGWSGMAMNGRSR